jgi:hypothetical protein
MLVVDITLLEEDVPEVFKIFCYILKPFIREIFCGDKYLYSKPYVNYSYRGFRSSGTLSGECW